MTEEASEMASKLLLDYFYLRAKGHALFNTSELKEQNEGVPETEDEITHLEILKEALLGKIHDIDFKFSQASRICPLLVLLTGFLHILIYVLLYALRRLLKKGFSQESVRNILKEMEGSNVQPSSFLFSRILASYRDRGEWQRSFQVLKEMKSSGIRPDRHFYNVMIDTFGKYNCLDHAMSTFEQMISEGIEPDTVTWNTLTDCHCKLGCHDRAEELFEEMQQKGYKPCTTTYNIMISCFGEQQRWKDVKGLFGRMQSQGLLPNVVTYTTLVDRSEEHTSELQSRP